MNNERTSDPPLRTPELNEHEWRWLAWEAIEDAALERMWKRKRLGMLLGDPRLPPELSGPLRWEEIAACLSDELRERLRPR